MPPVTEYGTTKAENRAAILAGASGRFDAVILRPTAVFGHRRRAAEKTRGQIWRPEIG